LALYPLPGPPLSPPDAEGGKGRVFIERAWCASEGAPGPRFLYIGVVHFFRFSGYDCFVGISLRRAQKTRRQSTR
jgi:hypothetical protein